MEKDGLNYASPVWAVEPSSDLDYGFDVIKNGCIIEKIKFDERNNKSFVVIGRADDSDIKLYHPSVSRYHCIIQYGNNSMDSGDNGWYLYDLASSHKTKLNKKEIEPKIYKRLRVGHLLQFGYSSRIFIFDGPKTDMEKEWECSPTEMQRIARANLLKKNQKDNEKQFNEENKEEGISWGMDFPEDEPLLNLSSNSDFDGGNEKYRNDPVKVLSNYFDREGFEMEFIYSESGTGYNHKWTCSIDLPINRASGGSHISAICSGSKKDAQIKCAMDACRTLDMIGELYKIRNEHKKRTDILAENDYYDSDDDTYLDRTGQIEKNRELRKRRAEETKTGLKEIRETYESLLLKIENIDKKIAELEGKIENFSCVRQQDLKIIHDGDEILEEITEINDDRRDDQKTKTEKSILRQQLVRMKHEKQRLETLAKIAKPVQLPELKRHSDKECPSSSISTVSLNRLLNIRRSKISADDKNKKTSLKRKIDVCEVDFVAENEDDDYDEGNKDFSNIEPQEEENAETIEIDSIRSTNRSDDTKRSAQKQMAYCNESN